MSLRPVEVNGGPGALFVDAQQRLIGVVALDIAGGGAVRGHGTIGAWTCP